MQLVRSLRTLRRRWRLLAVCAVIGAVAGFVLAPRPQTRSLLEVEGTTFVATHTLFTTAATRSGASNNLSLQQIAYLVREGDVPERVARRVGGDPDALAESVFAIPDTGLGTLEISVADPDPDRASLLADTFAEELQGALRDLRLASTEAQRAQLTTRLEQLQAELGVTPADTGNPVTEARRDALVSDIAATQQQLAALDRQAGTEAAFTSLRTAEPVAATAEQVDRLRRSANAQVAAGGSGRGGRGQTPSTLVSGRNLAAAGSTTRSEGVPPALGALLGGFGGLVAGAAAVLVLARLDPRVHTKEDAEEASGIPVVAEIPVLDRRQRRGTPLSVLDAPYSRHAESYRAVRSAVLYAESTAEQEPPEPGRERQGVVVMVTSAGPAEGKTTTAANLATALAEGGTSVLVVNCDFRRPRLHLYFGLDDEPRKVLTTSLPSLKVVTDPTTGDRTSSPAQIVEAQRQVILNGRRHFDYVVLDTAPLLTTSDASGLLAVSDMVVMVVRAGRTTGDSLRRSSELLERFAAPVIGAVLVAAPEAPSSRYYYYYSHDRPREEAPEGNPLNALVRRDGDDGTEAMFEQAMAEAAAERTEGPPPAP
jgi:Mrp family chromosome partitioning ATPase/capsular polysaccharide biosynthesis protein